LRRRRKLHAARVRASRSDKIRPLEPAGPIGAAPASGTTHHGSKTIRACVTGGAGFIGSQIVDALVARGDDVLILDDLSTGKREYLNPRANLVETSIATATDLAATLRGVDVVFHTAALARIQRSQDDPVGTHAVNVTGTLNILKGALDAGVRRVVYSSSSSVYGDQPTLPLTEDMTPDPVNLYASHKFMSEIYCRKFSQFFSLETVCLRYFNVYGPRQVMEGAYRLVIGIFMDQKAHGQPLTIHGDGEQTRDFTHVSDVVRANLLAAESTRVGKGEPINIGGGREISINQLAGMFGGPSVHTAPRGFDERFKRAGIQRAKELLDWEPAVGFEAAIADLVQSVPKIG
jgi:UDP-glucose 4-epimerase